MTGVVRKIVSEKQFGFVTADHTGADLFFHRTNCSTAFDRLYVGAKVSFSAEDNGAKGKRASGVALLAG
jgi:cold shock CspA family protein